MDYLFVANFMSLQVDFHRNELLMKSYANASQNCIAF